MRSLADLKDEIHVIETQIDGLAATLVRAHFAPGSAVPNLSKAARDSQIESARAAMRVRFEGGTDATGNLVLNVRLALDRAGAVRQLLLDGGVSPERLSIRVATTEYVASNLTCNGRAENRRVDVILWSPDTSSLSMGSTSAGEGLDR